MTTVYCIIFALSLLLPIGYYPLMRKKKKETWLFVLFLSVCVVDLGYLLLSLSRTVEFALVANKIAYFGQVFVPLCMFMIISGLCGFRYKKWVPYLLCGVAMAMFSLVLTTGHLDWYYRSVELIEVDGAAKLVKEYGFLHPVNLIYVLAYFAAMLAVIGVSMKKKRGKEQKLVWLMLAVVIANIGMWIVGKLVSLNFEFLSASYLMSEFVFFFVYWLLEDYVHVSDISKINCTDGAKLGKDIITLPMDIKIARVLTCVGNGESLTAREREVLNLILENKKRRDIATEMHLSENTVKTYTRTLYAKLGVTCREELYELLFKTN